MPAPLLPLPPAASFSGFSWAPNGKAKQRTAHTAASAASFPRGLSFLAELWTLPQSRASVFVSIGPPFIVRAPSSESSPPLKQKRARSPCPPEKVIKKSALIRRKYLLEFFRDHRELQFGLGEGLDNHPLGAFGGGVFGGSHFADQQVLGALQHFLFTEGEGLAAAEGNEALEDGGDFNQRSRAHALGVLLEAVLPVRMRVQFALFQEAQDLIGFIRAND